MNNRQLTIAAAVLVVLVSLFFIVSRKRDATWKRGTDAIVKNPLIEDLNVNSIANLTLKGQVATVSISRGKDGWTVNERGGFPANFNKVRRFLLKLTKLEIVQRPRVVESQFAELGLVKPNPKAKKSGVELRIGNANGDVMLGLILGDPHVPPSKGDNPYGARVQPDGRYVLLDGSKSPALVSDALPNAIPDPAAWIDDQALKVTNILSVALLGLNSKKEWEIRRMSLSAPWILDGMSKDESPKPYLMSSATSAFRTMRLNDVIALDSKKVAKLFDKAKTVVVRTGDNFVYKIRVAVKGDKGYLKYNISADIPEKPASGEKDEKANKRWRERREALVAKLEREKKVSKWIFEYPKYQIDSLLKKRSDFVTRKADKATSKDKSNREKGR